MSNDTINMIFQIIAAIGSLATFGAFLFLFRRDKDKQQQIDKLSGISESLETQNILTLKRLKSSILPELWLNGGGYDANGNLHIDLNNKGENAKLIEFNLHSDDLVLHSESLPYNLDKGKQRYIQARTIGKKHAKDSEYEIDIIYLDKLKNKYLTKVKGKGGSPKIVETKEL